MPGPDPAPAVRAAATVMLLRGGAASLEVLLLKRHLRSDVHGGVHVFPGGKVDDADADAGQLRFGEAHGLAQGFADPRVGPPQAATLYVAALRELEEECGIAIANPASMHPHSRWITPTGSLAAKRFDTWFFVGTLPAGAQARHDGHEAVATRWLRPREGLEQFWSGAIELAPPQLMCLAALARHGSAQAALAAARAGRPRRIQPEHIGCDGERIIAFPGDPQHSEPAAALPGPSRLVLRAGRFEPPGGFDDFFR